jgi:O-antigen/teichoic acid export membrane protein
LYRDAGVRTFGWAVMRTSVCNVAAAVVAGLAGIVIARALGPATRGQYAAILAWFGVVLVIGQLGQTAAVTYFVAWRRDEAADYLATSRTMMVASGAIVLTVGVLAAPLLSAGSGAPVAGYRLMFATCLASFVGACYVFSLQATDLARWNLARLLQPVAYFVIVAVVYLAGRLDLMTALGVLAGTIVVQSAFAYRLCARKSLTGGRTRRDLVRPLSRYGVAQLASAAPTMVTARLDTLVLSFAVPSAALGQYAVAASVTALALPVVSAVGNVSFPRIASRTLSPAGTARLSRWAILTSAVVGVVLTLPFVVTAPWLVPFVFGEGFRGAAPLVMLLAPGAVLLACGRVCADVLKGYGRPLAVAGAQTVAATATAVLLALLVPPFGTAGAAVASSAAAAIALLLMLRALRRPPAPDQLSGEPPGVQVGGLAVDCRHGPPRVVGGDDGKPTRPQ